MGEDHPTVLAAYVHTHGLGWQGLAREIRRTTGITISGEQLSRLGRGQSQSARADTRRAIEQTVNMRLPDLLKPPPPGGVSLVEPNETDNRPATPQEQLMSAAGRASRFHQDLTHSTVDTDAIADGLRDVALAYPRQPLRTVLPSIIDAQEYLFSLLERPQAPQQASNLYFLAGFTSGLLAKASHDSAEPLAAKAQARTARMCAEHAGHTGLITWADGLSSLISYWAGHPAEALRAAERGLSVASSSSNSVWLHYLAARAHATLGHDENAVASIRKAETLWERVESDDLDDLGGIATFTRIRGDYYAADALVELPQQNTLATEYSEQASTNYSDSSAPDWAFGDAAGAQAALARARIAAGSVDGAVDALTPVLDLPMDQRINGIVKCVSAVHRALRGTDAQEGADLRESIESFTQLPMKGIAS